MKRSVLLGVLFILFFCSRASGAGYEDIEIPQTPVLTLQEALIRGLKTI